MVKIWNINWACIGDPERKQEDLVSLSDYLDLQKALEEALDQWENFGKVAQMVPDWFGWKRISLLRAQFLDKKRA